jgi:pimeloyl-ACP methyl ester carboxylesterase
MGDLELPRAQDRVAPDRPVTREWGDPGGRPLVFWPGLNPWGSLQLVEVGPLLAARGMHVISIAPPGGGETPPLADPDGYLPSRLARLVLDIADDHDIGRFIYMGASWGASIGVHLGALHAERIEALVLLDAGHTDYAVERTRDDLAAEFEADQAGFRFDSWDAYFDTIREKVRTWRPALEPRYRAGMTEREGKIVPLASARAAAWALHGVAAEPPSSAWKHLTMPVTLVLATERSNPDAVARFRQAVPHAEIEVVDSRHDIPEDAPRELADLVARLLG